MAETNSCAACSALVAPEELAQGLAVRVSGRLLCPLCLDRLPGDAKVAVNQMRALRGMSVTTYRYFSGRHPGLPLFTFTTAALILGHRHKLLHGESFETPPLPPPGSRPRLPSAAEASRGDRTGWITVAGVAVLVLTGLVWLAVPSGTASPGQPPPVPPAPLPTVPAKPAVSTPVAPVPVRNPAGELTELGRRLDATPADAQAVADAAELLRDSFAPREVALRSRAESLIRDALAVHEAQQATARPQPIAAPPPSPPATITDSAAPAPRPEPPPAVIVEPPAPAQAQAQAAQPTAPPPRGPVAEPARPLKPLQVKANPAETCAVAVFWPKGAKPLLEAGGLPRIKDLPWPWPSGEAIHAPEVDRSKGRRLAIELTLPGVSADGGAILVVHPGRTERTHLAVSWTNGTAVAGQQTVELSGLRWQAIAIPATGTAELGQAELRLRLEDMRDLGDTRPFLVAGASTRSSGTPTPADHQPALPLLLPPALDTANGWSTFRTNLRKLANGQAGKLIDDRQFAFAKAKVLFPQVADCRSALRHELEVLLRIDRLPDGNPNDLPTQHGDFASPIAGWPIEAMGDLAEHSALVFGWRAEAWGADSDLGRRLDELLGKMLTANKRLRRPAVVPVLVLGEPGPASTEQRAAIERLWSAQALRLAGLGVPVIDLRQAQSAGRAAEIRARAAMLLADGLRQLDWLVKRQ